MVFSSPSFLFLFLPLVLLIYFAIPKIARNAFLLFASLLFYLFGEYQYIYVMLIYISINYFFARLIGNAQEATKKPWMVFAVTCDLTLLAVFKYANFIVDNIDYLLHKLDMPLIHLKPVHLPLGISFITFHAISYLVDIYRKNAPAQKNPVTFGLYIALFPQLIAGPIIRYKDIAEQLTNRVVRSQDFAIGIKRFVIGMGKKTLIANPMGGVADQIFALPSANLATPIAWLGIVCYTLQIYFDFSGYSDMAIGLCRMFGFRILENFNYPYISKSIREFWRRWHISLSNWFRDYLYIPLGGNRCSEGRNYFNLVTVFFLCGLWHGASWTFVIWGLYHGLFLVLERGSFGGWLENKSNILQHLYALLVVMIGWVFFRTTSLHGALDYIGAMFGFHHHQVHLLYPIGYYLNRFTTLVLIVGIIGSTPILPVINNYLAKTLAKVSYSTRIAGNTAVIGLETILLALVLLAAAMQLAANTYNPFIYFRF